MTTEGLKLRIDSKEARADLAALERSLDSASQAAGRMDRSLGKAVDNTSASLARASKSMEKYAQVAALLSKIRTVGDPSKGIREMANALDAIGRARSITENKVKTVRELAHALQGLKVPGSVLGISSLLTSLGRARVPSPAQIRNLRDFFGVLSTFKGTAGDRGLNNLVTTISNIRAPSKSTTDRLERLFHVLANTKRIPGAAQIARDLDMIAASGSRAAHAIGALPRGLGALNQAQTRAVRSGAALPGVLARTGQAATRAHGGVVRLSGGLSGLSSRFNLAYQAGTAFGLLFSTFTIAQFVRGIFNTSIEIQKLEKAMLFVTGSFSEAKTATEDYFKSSDKLGTRALSNAAAFGRFAVSASAIGANLKDIQDIYGSTVTALTAVGATSQQTEYALYGLSQMFSKGKISSEEFNRQVGEQVPGNVAAGVRALSKLTGKAETAASFFKAMKAGTIESLPFLREWSKEITRMFAPLLPVAEKRPDFQLNRVLNAFDKFKIAIGKSEFMREVTNQFKYFADTLGLSKDGVGGLNEQGQKLANTFGRNLASMVRTLADAVKLLINNFDTVVAVIKGLVAFSLIRTFAGWGTAAINAANGFRAMAVAAATARAATTAVAAGNATGAAVAATTNVPFAANMAGIVARRNAGGISPRAANAAARVPQQQITSFGTRGQNAIPTMNAMGQPIFLRGPAPAAAAGAARGGMGSIAMGGIDRIAGGLRMLGPLAMGAGIALAMFGDKLSGLKTQANNAVSYNDIAGGAFDSITDSIGNFVKNLTSGMGVLDGLSDADAFGKFVAGLLAFGKVVVGFWPSLMVLVGQEIGTWISKIIMLFVRAGQAIEAALSFNFSGAYKILSQISADEAGADKRQQGNRAAFMSSIDVGAAYGSIVGNAGKHADRRGQAFREFGAGGVMAQDALERQIQQRQKEDAAARRLGADDSDTGLTDKQGNALEARRIAIMTRMETATARGSPILRADADMKRFVGTIDGLEQAIKSLKTDSKGAIDLTGEFAAQQPDIDRTLARKQQETADVNNPIGKLNRLSDESNKILEMRLAGKNAEADVQEHINRLIEEGYNEDELRGSDAHKAAIQKFMDIQQQTRSLELQADLKREMLNIDMRLANLAGGNKPIQSAVNAQIASRALGGETFEHAKKRLTDSGDLARIQGFANANSQTGNAEARNAIMGQLEDDRANIGAENYQRQTRENYKRTLQDLTGSTSNSIRELEGAAAEFDHEAQAIEGSTAALAAHIAKQQQLIYIQDQAAVARKRIGESLDEGRANIGLDPSQRRRRASFIGALQEQTGSESTSIVELLKLADSTMVDFAKHAAEARESLENPPGLQRWVDSLEPFANRMEDIKANFMESLSSGITDAFMGEDVDWGAMAKDLRKQIVKAQVDEGLKGILGGLGMAKVTPEDSLMSAGDRLYGAADALTAAAYSLGSGGTGGGAGDLMSMISKGSAALGSDGNWTPGAEGFPDVGGAASGGGFLSRLLGGGAKSGGGKSGGLFGGLGNLAMGALLGGAEGIFGGLFGGDKADPVESAFPGGIIGNMSTNTLNATQVAAKSNPIADVLQLVASAALGSPSSGGGFSKLWGSFREGGYSNMPVNYARLPQYAEGTGNTSGGFPAMLHPDEAVIPLSRGRKVPVEMGNDNRPVNVSSNITVIAPNPDAFRKSKGSMNRDQNRTMRRAALRNLT